MKQVVTGETPDEFYARIEPADGETVMSALLTAEEAAEVLGRISAATIRRLAKQGRVEWVRGPRGRVLLTEAQVQGVLDYLTQPRRAPVVTVPDPEGVDALTSARSRSRAGHR